MKKGLGGLHISRTGGGAVRGGKYSDKDLYKAFCDGYREGLAYNGSDEDEESLLTIGEGGRVVIKEDVEDIEDYEEDVVVSEELLPLYRKEHIEEVLVRKFYELGTCDSFVTAKGNTRSILFIDDDFVGTTYKGIKCILFTGQLIVPMLEDSVGVKIETTKEDVIRLLSEMLGEDGAWKVLHGRVVIPIKEGML